jgi:hypothetical protein
MGFRLLCLPRSARCYPYQYGAGERVFGFSEAITGYSITEEEDAQAVWEVLEQHTMRYGDPLALLLDNDKVNYKVVAEKLQGVIRCLETKAVLEGEFGNLEREFGPVRIQGRDKRELAKGILKSMVALYVSLRNQKPRCSVCSRTPLKLMEEGFSPQKLEQAKVGLKERQKRPLALKEDPPVGSEKVSLIEDILTRAGLYVEDKERFLKTLLKYDEKAIREAEADFFALSQRDSFSESKRSGQYFVGIVRNKQIDRKALNNLKKEDFSK